MRYLFWLIIALALLKPLAKQARIDSKGSVQRVGLNTPWSERVLVKGLL